MDVKFMELAIAEAEKAAKKDEVPVGAVIVKDGKLLAKAHNLTERKKNATRHAEMIVIEKASKKLRSWRLTGCEIYVTVEPCAMCAGAIVNARVDKVYFGAKEEKSGCAESKYPVLSDGGLNHSVEFEGGIMGEKCANLIKSYFKSKRIRKSLD